MMESYKKKIVSFTKLLHLRQSWQDKKIVTTNGCFDLLHIGHLHLLEKAKSLGDILIVGINSDESVRALKGKERPLQPEKERAALVAALSCVDYVFLFKEKRPLPYLLKLKPSIHIKGGDYKKEELPEKEALEKIGTEVLIGPFLKGKSTTHLLQKIKKRALEACQ